MVPNENDLSTLYLAHLRGELGTNDPRWLSVTEQIHEYVRTCAERQVRNLYGEPLNTIIDKTTLSVQSKFIERKMTARTGNIMHILSVTVRRDLMSAIRDDKSPTTVVLMGDVKRTSRERPVAQNADPFDRVRDSMRTFRWTRFPYAREIILSFLLSTHEYPGPEALRCLRVPPTERRAVYNSALFDINCAVWAPHES